MDDRETRQFINTQRHALSQMGESGTYGMVVNYNRVKNTATVLLAEQDSDRPDDVLNNVPCPSLVGIQTCAPEPGRMCWVVFRGHSRDHPVIVSFFNPYFEAVDHPRHNGANFHTPRYIMEL